jgi:hypothetical protein
MEDNKFFVVVKYGEFIESNHDLVTCTRCSRNHINSYLHYRFKQDRREISYNLCLICVSELIDHMHREVIPKPPHNEILIKMAQNIFPNINPNFKPNHDINTIKPNIFIEDPVTKKIFNVSKNIHDKTDLYKQKYLKYKAKYLEVTKNNL